MQDTENKDKKYFKTSFIIITFLIVGPFALPLVWFNPRLSKNTKILVSIIVIALTLILTAAMAQSINSLNSYYQQISQMSF